MNEDVEVKIDAMNSLKATILLTVCVFLLASSRVEAVKPNNNRRFKSTVLPILEAKCFGCHGADVQEADIRLDNLSTDFLADRAAATAWHEAMHVLNKGEMPPEDGEPLTAKERNVLVGWIRGEIDRVKAELKSTGGQVVLRRLNRSEYQNTMQDLLGLEMDYARDLPPEGASPDGFKNNGQSLQMTAIQLEYYLDAARRGLDRIIETQDAPEVFEHTFEKSNVGDKWFNYEVSNYLGRWQGFWSSPHSFQGCKRSSRARPFSGRSGLWWCGSRMWPTPKAASVRARDSSRMATPRHGQGRSESGSR